MWGLFKYRFFTFFAIICVLIFALAIYSSSVEHSKANVISDVAGIVLSPVQKAFSWGAGGVANYFNYLGSLGNAQRENVELKKHIVQLEENTRGLDEFKSENERLRLLLDIKKRQVEFSTVGAEVIAKEPGNYFTVFTIDKGTMDGIQKDCPVICEKGLVGYVFDIGTTWAKVITIIDPGCSVGAGLPRTGESVVVEGDYQLFQQGLCKMSFLPKNAGIMTGDTVETSGLGGIFPKGIFIGRVKEIKHDINGISKYVIVEPATDFQRIREVLVIKK